MFADGRVIGHNWLRLLEYDRSMDPMFLIPKDRKPIRPLRLVLLLGMTVLLFLLIALRYGHVAEVIFSARVG